ncbi:hypothetical protein CO614_11035 [Lysobacteraceae bacterium NML120232]|nr:hypothetical protein CO614_11035 [Xanthomonadaceae bacterium NML120232]
MKFEHLQEAVNKSINESSLSRVQSKLAGSVCGVITAYRHCKEWNEEGNKCEVLFTNAENAARNNAMLAKLLSRGYSVTSLNGSYIENKGTEKETNVKEHSFFVAPREKKHNDTIEADLIALGREFDQDSVLIINDGKGKLVGTSSRPGTFPKLGATHQLSGFVGGIRAEDFMSAVNGRPFVFKEHEHRPPNTGMGTWAMYAIARKPWDDSGLLSESEDDFDPILATVYPELRNE